MPVGLPSRRKAHQEPHKGVESGVYGGWLSRPDSYAGAGGLHGCEQEGEDIRVHVLPRLQVLEWLEQGRVNNGHTLIALQWLQLHGEALRQRW